MALRELTVNLAVPRGDGLDQAVAKMNYIYVYDDRIEVHTKQGNVVPMPWTAKGLAFLKEAEDAMVVALETAPKAPEAAEEGKE